MLCPILLFHKSYAFFLNKRANIYKWEKIKKEFIPYFAFHFHRFFLPSQCPAGCFTVPTGWQPCLPHLTWPHPTQLQSAAIFMVPAVIQKGGFFARLLTMRQVMLMPHSKQYGWAQTSGRSCSITFLRSHFLTSALMCIIGDESSTYLHLASFKLHKHISCPPHCSMIGLLNFSSQPITGYTGLVSSCIHLFCHSSWTFWPIKMWLLHQLKKPGTNYSVMQHHIPEEWRLKVCHCKSPDTCKL